jgi:amidase
VSWRTPFALDEDQRNVDVVRAIYEAQSPLLATAMLGTPGLSVPLPGKQPMGVHLMAEPFREDLCFAAAGAIERQAGAVRPVDPA